MKSSDQTVDRRFLGTKILNFLQIINVYIPSSSSKQHPYFPVEY
jgi:hypothetical protein